MNGRAKEPPVGEITASDMSDDDLARELNVRRPRINRIVREYRVERDLIKGLYAEAARRGLDIEREADRILADARAKGGYGV